MIIFKVLRLLRFGFEEERGEKYWDWRVLGREGEVRKRVTSMSDDDDDFPQLN